LENHLIDYGWWCASDTHKRQMTKEIIDRSDKYLLFLSSHQTTFSFFHPRIILFIWCMDKRICLLILLYILFHRFDALWQRPPFHFCLVMHIRDLLLQCISVHDWFFVIFYIRRNMMKQTMLWVKEFRIENSLEQTLGNKKISQSSFILWQWRSRFWYRITSCDDFSHNTWWEV